MARAGSGLAIIGTLGGDAGIITGLCPAGTSLDSASSLLSASSFNAPFAEITELVSLPPVFSGSPVKRDVSPLALFGILGIFLVQGRPPFVLAKPLTASGSLEMRRAFRTSAWLYWWVLKQDTATPLGRQRKWTRQAEGAVPWKPGSREAGPPRELTCPSRSCMRQREAQHPPEFT